MQKSIPFEDHHRAFLHDPDRAKAYLEIALENYEKDEDSDAFLLALRDIAEAQGGLGKLAKATKLNRGHVYKALSQSGNPRLDTMEKILRELGFKLWIKPLNATAPEDRVPT